MKSAGSIVSLVLGVLLLPFLAGAAQAQSVPTQTHTYNVTSTNMTGWTACYCCYCTPTQRGPNPGSTDNLDITLAQDTIGYTYVSIEITVSYTYSQVSGAGFNVFLNNTQIGQGPSLQVANSCSPTGTSTAVNTLTLQPGNTLYNVGATNTLRFTNTSSGCWGLLNGSAGWCLQIVVTGLNQDPLAPTNLGQIGSDGKGIGVGSQALLGNLTLRATVNDPDNDDCFLEAEVVAPTVFFANTPNYVGSPAASGNFAMVSVQGLPEGPYHWHVRSVDEFDFTSAWVSFGGNSEIVPDFVVSNLVTPPKPIDGQNHGGGDCNISAGVAGGLMSPALLGLALLAFGLARKK